MKHSEERKRKIAAFLSSEFYTPMTLPELHVVLDVPEKDREEFNHLINQMVESGAVRVSGKGRYVIPEQTRLIRGTIQGTAGRFFFLIPDDKGKDDVFIAPDKMNGAMHGDSVLVKSLPAQGDERRFRGEVVQILNEQRNEVLGTVRIGRETFLVPFDKRYGDINIAEDSPVDFYSGDVVSVEIIRAAHGRLPATGIVKSIIARSSDPRAFYKYLLQLYGYSEEYPVEAVSEAKAIAAMDNTGTPGQREDYRDLLTVTIDGADAKDLDDAVSLEARGDGTYILWVHIADVSHYVREGSELDKEAADRGTSVYLVDRVIPMLPEILSNGLCSLNPNEDKLAFSVRMTIDASGNVTESHISESIIRSNERMTYDNVHKLLQGGHPELEERYRNLLPFFRNMYDLSVILRGKRRNRGSIDFDFQESKVIVDSNGRPVEVKQYDITDANRIIEEFMILCNETVAEEFGWIGFPFIFRVHGKPDQEKIHDLNRFLSNMGLNIKSPGNIHPAAIQKVLQDAKGKPFEHLVNTVVLRSMQKAVYSTVNEGHFGLASENYSHFTSPIRRYPDLMIHRLIKKKINSEKEGFVFSERDIRLMEAHAATIAGSSSEMERKAERSERQLVDYYKALYMEDHIGEVFDGVVSGVTGFGMFVELENTVEGLIRVDNLDGYYIFDKENHSLYMKNGPGRYTIGMPVKVRVVSVNINRGEIDMVLEGKRKPDVNKRKKEVRRTPQRKYSRKKRR